MIGFFAKTQFTFIRESVFLVTAVALRRFLFLFAYIIVRQTEIDGNPGQPSDGLPGGKVHHDIINFGIAVIRP